MDTSQIDYLVIDFPGRLRTDVLVPRLEALVRTRTVEILDLAFIRKAADGSVRLMELESLGSPEAEAFLDLEGRVLGLLSEEDLELVGEQLPPDTVAAVLVWENAATRALRQAVEDAGGCVVAHERVPAHLVEQDLAATGVR